ncbi:uncharacterized protein J3R85_009566 [Psidium guajava]|nr:uncharacterized protein J3R85_009566 [Psidium guajava]
MDETERLIGLWSREGHTASAIIAAHQLMQLSDEESCSNSSRGSNRSSWAVKRQSKGSDHPSRSKATSTGKMKTKVALDRSRPLRPQKERKYRSIIEIYAETVPVDARIGDDHRREDRE